MNNEFVIIWKEEVASLIWNLSGVNDQKFQKATDTVFGSGQRFQSDTSTQQRSGTGWGKLRGVHSVIRKNGIDKNVDLFMCEVLNRHRVLLPNAVRDIYARSYFSSSSRWVIIALNLEHVILKHYRNTENTVKGRPLEMF